MIRVRENTVYGTSRRELVFWSNETAATVTLVFYSPEQPVINWTQGGALGTKELQEFSKMLEFAGLYASNSPDAPILVGVGAHLISPDGHYEAYTVRSINQTPYSLSLQRDNAVLRGDEYYFSPNPKGATVIVQYDPKRGWVCMDDRLHPYEVVIGIRCEYHPPTPVLPTLEGVERALPTRQFVRKGK